MVAPEIAIADSNTLSCMGLQSLLEEIIPMAVIRVFSSFEELMDDTPDMYIISFQHRYILSIPLFSYRASPRPLYWQTVTISLNWQEYRP